MNLSEMLVNHTYLFMLVLLRYIGMFILTPFFSSDLILTRVKLGLSLLLTVTTFPLLRNIYTVEFPVHLLQVVGDGIRELAIGILLGFVLLLVFAAFQLAGKLIDLRMGFRIANELDPLTGESAPIMGQLKNVLATLLFLVINGHLLVVRGLFNSFSLIPPAEAVLTGASLWQFVVRRSADLFIVGFQIALPVVGTIFMIDVLLGFLARSVPQMNIFIVGLPFKILVGFVVLFLSLSVLVHFYEGLFDQFFQDMLRLFNLLR